MRQAGHVADDLRVALWRDGAVQLAAADEPVVTAFDQGPCQTGFGFC